MDLTTTVTRGATAVLVAALLPACGSSGGLGAGDVDTDLMRRQAEAAIDEYLVTKFTVHQSELQQAGEQTAYVLQLSDPATTPGAVGVSAAEAVFYAPLVAFKAAISADPDVLAVADTFLLAFRDGCRSVYELDRDTVRVLMVETGTPATFEQDMQRIVDGMTISSRC